MQGHFRRVKTAIMSMDLVLMLVVLTIVVCTWTFLVAANEVLDEEPPAIDLWLLKAFRTPADPRVLVGPHWMESVFIDISALGGYAVLSIVTFTVVGYLIASREVRTAALVFFAAGGGLMLSYALKHSFGRPRPKIVPPLLELASLSFPSGHAQLSTVIYVTLGAILARSVTSQMLRIYIMAVAISLAFLIGTSRVVLGVHYPTDVVAGWSVGLLWAIACWWCARQLQRSHVIEPPTPDAVAPPSPDAPVTT